MLWRKSLCWITWASCFLFYCYLKTLIYSNSIIKYMEIFYSIGIAGLLILLGAFFTILSKKINYPLMILLLIIGMFLGPITGLFNPFQFHPVINSFVTLALVIVLFEVGYNTRFSELKKNFARSIWITLISVFFTITLCSLIAILFLKVEKYL